MSEQIFRIYVKSKDMRTYGAIGSGGVVGNLIYASTWWDKESAIKAFNGLSQANPELAWQLRNTAGKVIDSYKPVEA